jgi:hypothetical protein
MSSVGEAFLSNTCICSYFSNCSIHPSRIQVILVISIFLKKYKSFLLLNIAFFLSKTFYLHLSYLFSIDSPFIHHLNSRDNTYDRTFQVTKR